MTLLVGLKRYLDHLLVVAAFCLCAWAAGGAIAALVAAGLVIAALAWQAQREDGSGARTPAPEGSRHA